MTATAIPVAVTGFTWTAAGVWVIILGIVGRIVIRWIMGMPDRKRADIEGDVTQEAAIDAQWKRFQGEINRLLSRVEHLEDRVKTLEGELDESRAKEVAAVSEVARLKAVNAGQGQTRQEAAVLVSAERIVGDKRARG